MNDVNVQKGWGNISYLLIAIAVSAVLVFTTSHLTSPDDIALNALDPSSPKNWWAHFENYRYVMFSISRLLQQLGIAYATLMPLWVLVFTAGLVLACLAFVDYVQIPRSYLPAFIVAVTLHGFLSDIYQFPMSYLLWGMGWLFIATALFALKYIDGAAGIIVASACSTLCLMSYQPFLLILLFAAALAYLNIWSRGKEFEHKAFAAAWKPIAVAILASAAFLLAIKIFNPNPLIGRPVSMDNVWVNLNAYLAKIVDSFTDASSIGRIWPLHERVIYGAGIIAAVFVFGALAIRRRAISSMVAVAALLCAIVIMPSPFNLFTNVFWPTPRSMSSAVFFQIGILMLLYMRLPLPARREWIVMPALLVFFVISALNQFALYAGMSNQMARDRAFAELILKDINTRVPITPETRIAVRSTGYSTAQNANAYMDAGLSAFSQGWSNWSFLHSASPTDFRMAEVPEGACAMPITDWVIERREDVVVVCMN